MFFLHTNAISRTGMQDKNELEPIDKTVFLQSNEAIKNKNWSLAFSLLNGLYEQYPNNLSVKNNFAIVLFQLEKLNESQALFVEIVEHEYYSRIAYRNLKKLYSYSAAKTYSKGLNLLKPIERPELNFIESDSQYHLKNFEKSSVKVDSQMPLSKDSNVSQNNIENDTETTPEYINEDVVAEGDNLNNDVIDKLALEKLEQNERIKTETNTLLGQLEGWQNAWSNGDVERYLGYYKNNYSPPGRTRDSWIKNRKERVIASNNIRVTITEPDVAIQLNQNTAQIRFIQSYRSRSYSDKVEKRLYWKKIDGQWLITKESIIRVL
jgi:ketosteroid isomerase-like protein